MEISLLNGYLGSPVFKRCLLKSEKSYHFSNDRSLVGAKSHQDIINFFKKNRKDTKTHSIIF